MNELLRRLLFLPEQASSVASDIDHFHYVVIGITMTGALGVALAAAWFSIRYRFPSRVPASFERGLTRRFELWMIGGVLSLFIALWAVGVRQYVRLRTPPDDTLDVYVVAKQWMWSFAHVEGPSELGTLTIPAGRPVRLIMTSRDVIHSFFVPAFRVKQDVIPGRYVATWFEAKKPGAYELLCTEFCGVSHSLMRATVRVLPGDEYGEWLRGAVRERGLVSMIEHGRDVAARKQCLACHTVDGRRHVGPTWRGLYLKEQVLTNGEHVRADEEYLTRSIMKPYEQIVQGYAPVMPSFEGLLTPADVGALVEYIRSLESPPDPEIETAPPLVPPPAQAPDPGRK